MKPNKMSNKTLANRLVSMSFRLPPQAAELATEAARRLFVIHKIKELPVPFEQYSKLLSVDKDIKQVKPKREPKFHNGNEEDGYSVLANFIIHGSTQIQRTKPLRKRDEYLEGIANRKR